MKHYLKNKSESNTLVFGNVEILPGESYMLYDDALDIYGNYFKSFKNNFTTEHIDSLEYIIDDEVKTIKDFYKDYHIFSNDKKVNTYEDLQNYRIYYLLNEDKKHLAVNPTLLPSSVNYKIDIQKLHVKFEFKKGILIKAEYFENVQGSQDPYGLDVYTYSNPVLKCEFEYHVDNSSYISYRYTRRYWAYCDGTYSTEYKEGPKYYDKFSARTEALRRRTNIVNDVIMTAGGLLLYTEPSLTNLVDAENAARPLLGELDPQIDKYYKGSENPLMTAIATIDESSFIPAEYSEITNWLDNIVPGTGTPGISIRQLMLSKLSEGALTPNETITI